MKRFTIILFICIIIFNSCVSEDELIVLDSIPSWVKTDLDNDNIESNINYYRIEGIGATVEEATLNAVTSFYDSFSKSIYIPNKDIFISSLLNDYYYKPLELKIEKKYYLENEDSLNKIVYLLTANKSIIEQESLNKIEKDQQVITDLEQFEKESNLLYRENKDYDSIKILIDAYIKANENGFIDKANTYLNTIITRISALSIKVYAKSNKNILEIRVNRNQGLINPTVKGVNLIAQYNSKDVDFQNYLSSEDLLPFKDNSFTFYLDDKNINLKGLIIFKIDLSNEVALLRSKNFNEAADRIELVIDEIVFPYERISDFQDKKVMIVSIENDVYQQRRESSTIEFFTTQLKKLGAQVIVKEIDDFENIDEFKSEADYLFLFKGEVLESQVAIKVFVSSHGSLEIYDLNSLELIFQSSLIESVAIEDTLEIGEKVSLINVAKRAFHNYF